MSLQEVKVCSPDYDGMDQNEAIEDFLERIKHYQQAYEPMDHVHDKDLSFIQIFNQGERFLVNKLAGNVKCFISVASNIHSFLTSNYSRGLKFAIRQFIYMYTTS